MTMWTHDEVLENLRKMKPNAHKRRPYKVSVQIGLELGPRALMFTLRRNCKTVPLLSTPTAPGLTAVVAVVVNYQPGQQLLKEVGGSSP